jgi:hypothetical protein
MKRHHFIAVAFATMAAFLACGGETTSPTVSSSAVVRIDIAGPSSVAPGASAQFTATGRQVDGATRDVTSEVNWVSSNRNILSASSDGRFSGVAAGDARVSASLPGANASKEVVVVPQGTFRLAGLVTEADAAASPIVGATVSIIGGSGDGLSTTTGADGRYRVYGVGGDVRVRVTKDGYEPFEQPYQAVDHAMVNAQLRLLQPRRDLSGIYTLTIAAADDCRLELAEGLRVRNYVAAVTQTGNQLDVRLEGAAFAISKVGRGSSFRGRSEPNTILFTLTPYDATDYFYYTVSYGDIVEQLAELSFLIVSGRVMAVESASGFAGTLDGALTVYRGRLSYFPEIDMECRSSNHRITFRR